MATSIAAPAAADVGSEAAALNWSAFARLLPVLLQLAAAALVIRSFQLESRTFYQIFLLATVAFPIHALLPLRYRLPFFAAVSLAGIGLALGLRDGLMLVGGGLVLIAACHLPVRFSVRIAVVLALAVLLALARAGVAPSPVSAAVWPILGSMFMFRLALYLHALRYDDSRPTFARTLSYFFLLPNVCYPLFPVVDYSTFGRTYYDAEAGAIYQRGVKWIVRGLVHLLLYRLVYLNFTIDVTEVDTLGRLLQALLSVFFLYLRISGQFHLIVGILHLFGFHLPETHRLYFLASSITDYWRRINIYWKDFMMKLVYYPSFFRLRRRGDRMALVLSTMLVFFATWALHSYQWFWLRSEFPVTPQDIAFWGLLGGLVVVNTLREAKRGRKRTLAAPRRRWSASLAARTLGTFALLCVLWSLWSAESLVDWLWLWPAALEVGPQDLLLLLGLLTVGLAVGGVNWDAPVAAAKGAVPFYRRTEVQTLATLAVLLVLGSSAAQERSGPRTAALLASLQNPALNRRDADLQRQGYYENLDDRGRLSMQLWQVVQQRPADWKNLVQSTAYLKNDDFLSFELQPNARDVLSGQPASINRWGMRDRDYALTKPAGTRRIALLGPSYVMGMGVRDHETIDAQLEALLNERSAGGDRYEVMNFGVAAYSLLQQVRMLEQRVFSFEPDVVVLTDVPSAAGPVVSHLTSMLSQEVPVPYAELMDIVERAGVEDFPGQGLPMPTAPLRRVAHAAGIPVRMPWREANLRLTHAADDIITWAFQHAAEQARSHGSVPVFLAVSLGPVPLTVRLNSPLAQSAGAAGLVTVDLLDLYDGLDRRPLQLAPWDGHPNAAGTRLIADRILHEFEQRESELRLGLTVTATPAGAQ